MAEEKAKRTRRTVEDRIAEIDAKIAALEARTSSPRKDEKDYRRSFCQHESRRNG